MFETSYHSGDFFGSECHFDIVLHYLFSHKSKKKIIKVSCSFILDLKSKMTQYTYKKE